MRPVGSKWQIDEPKRDRQVMGEEFMAFIQGLGLLVLVAPALVFICLVLVFHRILSLKKDRMSDLQIPAASPGQTYRALLGELLDRVDRALVPDHATAPPSSGGRLAKFFRTSNLYEGIPRQARRVARHPFGWPLLDASLRLAFFYPVALLAVLSAVTGLPVTLGSMEILPSGYPWSKLVLAAAVLLLMIANYAGLPPSFRKPATVLGFILLVLGVTGSGSTEFGRAVLFTLGFASIIPLAAAGRSKEARHLLMLALAMSVGLWITDFVGLLQGLLIMAILLAAIFAIDAVLVRAVRRGHSLVGWSIFIALVAAGFAIFTYFYPDDELVVLTIFMGLLPMANGLTDYLSAGFSRRLMRSGLRKPGEAFLLWLVNLGVAVLVVTALGLLLILGINGINALRGQTIIDVSQVLREMGTPSLWWKHLWIYLMILTPLVLSLVQASIGIASLLLTSSRHSFPEMVEAAAPTQQQGTGISRNSLRLAAVVTVSILLPIYLLAGLGWLLWTAAPGVVRTSLSIFWQFAEWAP